MCKHKVHLVNPKPVGNEYWWICLNCNNVVQIGGYIYIQNWWLK